MMRSYRMRHQVFWCKSSAPRTHQLPEDLGVDEVEEEALEEKEHRRTLRSQKRDAIPVRILKTESENLHPV
jgi:hypothetical protein